MTESTNDTKVEPDGGPDPVSPSVPSVPPAKPGMTRNQRVAWGIVGITMGLVVGIWMALVLAGINAIDEPTGDVDELQQELERLHHEVDTMSLALEGAQGQLGDNEGSLVSIIRLVDEVKLQMGGLMEDADDILLMTAGQGGELENLRNQLDETREELDATREQLFEAFLQLEYAKGRQDGAQPSANLTLDELATVLAQLSTAISQMETTQDALSDAVAGLLGVLGAGPPDGMALYSPHLSHYESPLIDFRCSMCHNVDLEGGLTAYDGELYFNGSLASEDFRVQIDKNRVCSDCHDWFPLGEMDPEDKDRSCFHARCHDDWMDQMDSPYVNEDVIVVDDCLLCHGGQPFYPR